MEELLKHKRTELENILNSINLLEPAYYVGQLELIEELLNILAHKEEAYDSEDYYTSEDDNN